jgi:hypothetical protein
VRSTASMSTPREPARGARSARPRVCVTLKSSCPGGPASGVRGPRRTTSAGATRVVREGLAPGRAPGRVAFSQRVGAVAFARSISWRRVAHRGASPRRRERASTTTA